MTIRNAAPHIPVTSIDASREAGSKLLLHYGTLDDDVRYLTGSEPPREYPLVRPR